MREELKDNICFVFVTIICVCLAIQSMLWLTGYGMSHFVDTVWYGARSLEVTP